jgi:hypothetical protein
MPKNVTITFNFREVPDSIVNHWNELGINVEGIIDVGGEDLKDMTYDYMMKNASNNTKLIAQVSSFILCRQILDEKKRGICITQNKFDAYEDKEKINKTSVVDIINKLFGGEKDDN